MRGGGVGRPGEAGAARSGARGEGRGAGMGPGGVPPRGIGSCGGTPHRRRRRSGEQAGLGRDVEAEEGGAYGRASRCRSSFFFLNENGCCYP